MSESQRRIISVSLIAITAVLYLLRLGDRAVVSEELRWAEIAREMRSSGEYLHPSINDHTYYDKPVGSYWLIVAASYLTGGVDETAARLPSALSGLVGIGLVMLLARRFYDDQTALMSGAILATCYGYAFYSRRATADIETVVGVLAALCLFVDNQHRSSRWWVVPLWMLMAATSQMKGLLGFALPLAVLGADSIVHGIATRGESNWLRAILAQSRWFLNRWTLLAVPLGGIIYLLPFLISASQSGSLTGLEMVWRENLKRFVDPHNHKGPVYLYVGVIFVLAAPWSLFLIAALITQSKETMRDRFVRVYFWSVFLFFTASASRRSYYLLPVLPPLAMLIAHVLMQPRAELGPIARRLRDLGWGMFAVIAVLAGVVLVPPAWVLPHPYNQFPPLPDREFYAIGWLATLGLLALSFSGRVMRFEWAAVVAVFALQIYILGIAWPAMDDQRTRRAFVAEVHAQTDSAPDQLVLFHARDVVFDYGRTVPEYTDVAALTQQLTSGKARWFLARRRYLANTNFPARIILEEAARPWEGEDQLGDKLILLEAVKQ